MSQHAPSPAPLEAPPNEAQVPNAAVSRAAALPAGKNPPCLVPLAPLSSPASKSLIATVPRIEMQPNSLQTKEKTFSNSNKNGMLASRFLLAGRGPFQPESRLATHESQATSHESPLTSHRSRFTAFPMLSLLKGPGLPRRDAWNRLRCAAAIASR
jgi:hypothetical protein